jgi:hypothetical protein
MSDAIDQRVARQLVGLQKLISISTEVTHAPSPGADRGLNRIRGRHPCPDGGRAVPLAPGQATPGALSASYEVPRVRYVRAGTIVCAVIAVFVIAGFTLRWVLYRSEPAELAPVWAIGFAMRAVPLMV